VSKKKENKTNALRLLEQRKIVYEEHHYAWSEEHLDANEVAVQLPKKAPEEIFKTLVAQGNKTGILVAVIPSNRELDLKKIAQVSGNKKVEMLPLKDLEQTTGYLRGGCSPVGMKKLFPTFIDDSAQNFATIVVSAGRRGLQMEVNPNDLLKVIKGQFVQITKE
jgi:Cys-tRNA(Pro)/Cys-tRNA(Cys) deacylase